MSNLSAFLNPTYTEETIEVVVSDRFVDENGNPVPFKLRSMTQDEIQALMKRSYVEVTINGRKARELDKILHLNRCLVASCIQPNFKDHELCEHYGTQDPVTLPQKMLLTREYEKLALAFMKLNGLDEESEVGEITKN